MTTVSDQSVAGLANLYGLEVAYADGLGGDRVASRDAIIAVLRGLGAEIAGDSDVPVAARTRRETLTARLTEPVAVVWEGANLDVALHVDTRARKLTWSLELESGEQRSGVARVTDLEAAGPARDGRRQRNLRLPGPLPLGYHRLNVEVGRRRAGVTVIAAPRRAYRPPEVEASRAWGLFAPTYALHSAREMPIGDLADLEALARWTSDLGGSFVGTLPLLAAFLDEPFAPSPYQPASRLFWNELFVALDRLPEARHLGLADREFRARATALCDAELVDYREAMRLKRVVLERASGLAFEQEQRRRQIESWAEQVPAAVDYARFRAAMERHGTDRGRWPARLRDGDVHEEDGDRQAQRYHLYVQHAMQQQITELAASDAGLYLDLPLGVHAHGYDTWRLRELFVGAAAAGAPPDALSAGGQNWGFPGLHPEQSRLRGHAYFAACLRHHMRAAAALRIDHVMGLHRLFLIPDGFEARDGVYLRYPVEELYAVVCLESVRNRCMVVGEDLGTVPPEVRPMLAEHGLHRMYVGQFELDTETFAALRPVPPNSVASFGTHDTATFAGYWRGHDVDDHVELGGIPAQQGEAERQRRQEIERALRRFLGQPDAPDLGALLRGVLRHLATGSAAALLVTLEDLWLEPRPQNVPGTTEERPNWRRRLDRSLEAVQADPNVNDVLREVDDLRRGSHAIASSEAKRRTMTGLSPQLTDDDIYLFNEGTHARLYQKLGAQPMSEDGVAGTQFAVWAPDADAVSVVGDFNGWSDSSHPLQPVGSSGIWRAFIAGVGHGALYKYRIRSRFGGAAVNKADPFGQSQETPPRTASRVWESSYTWGDESWMRTRRERNELDAPISIYEVHLGSWRRVPEEGNRSLSYRELARQLADYVEELGFSHVEFLPVMEHPFYGSWGYQVTGYFAPSGRFGTPDDFRYLVDHLHQRGIGVILDWVPAHFPTDEHGLGDFDGTHLYEHADPKRGFHPDWKSYIFNYDRNEVRSFLMSSATYWLDQFHADGLRVDGVASMLYLDYSRGHGEWVPNELGGRENLGAISLLRQINEAVYRDFPDVQMIAEESTAWPMVSRPTYVGGLGFGFKWDMGWMHDTLRYMAHAPVHRRYHHNELTFRGIYAFTENYVLPLSHDEVVHGKGSLLGRMPGDDWQKHANLRALLAAMWAQPGKKLLFMGGEIAQWAEWDHDSSVEWHLLEHAPHRGTRDLVAELNRLYRDEAALHLHDVRPEGFEWVDANDAEQSVLSFLRRGSAPDDVVLVVCNLTPVPRHDYVIGAPSGGAWREILNTDADQYGGSGVGNGGSVEASDAGCHGRPFSLRLTLPPLGVLYLVPSAG